jgi:GNAT superfamily N-acetyltransferase
MFTIRPYRDADQDAVLTLHHRALERVGADRGDGPWDDDLRSIRAVYLDARGTFLVGELNGRLIAMGALQNIGHPRGEIRRMRVDPAFQGRGFGEQILYALEACALALGYTVLALDTPAAQTAARRLYPKHGFQETARTDQAGMELVFMERRLRP